jgi:hypothetical protein
VTVCEVNRITCLGSRPGTWPVAMVFAVKRGARLGKAGTGVVSVTQRWHEDADTGAQTQSVSCRRMQFLGRE